ncbi:hypothetical protein [Niameybacter massiliensis]|uniref:hypothetical protein n=1 Tax=Niameybacter massiliensis TaxID=1658108 RepID=UPI0006B50136|nr:hypothetical protein [Niameybacter massiliensis]
MIMRNRCNYYSQHVSCDCPCDCSCNNSCDHSYTCPYDCPYQGCPFSLQDFQPSSTSTFTSRASMFVDTLQLVMNSTLADFLNPSTFTLYSDNLTTPQDMTEILKIGDHKSPYLQFTSISPYDTLPLNNLYAFSIQIKNPPTNLPILRSLLRTYFPDYSCTEQSSLRNSLTCHDGFLNVNIQGEDFTNLELVGLSDLLACFTQSSVTTTSPPVPYSRLIITYINDISAVGHPTF